jgi:hypothetical protein
VLSRLAGIPGATCKAGRTGDSGLTHLFWLIVACEVGFWLVLLAALVTRYLLRRERVSWLLLLALPAIDLLLLAFTAMDLRSGRPATFAHGLAAAYVGFTVAFGPITVAWADRHFAHRFADGPEPAGLPERRWLAVRYELGLWLRCIVAAAITIALLVALIAYVDDDQITAALNRWFGIAVGSVIFWFVFGPVWTLVFFRKRA